MVNSARLGGSSLTENLGEDRKAHRPNCINSTPKLLLTPAFSGATPAMPNLMVHPRGIARSEGIRSTELRYCLSIVTCHMPQVTSHKSQLGQFGWWGRGYRHGKTRPEEIHEPEIEPSATVPLRHCATACFWSGRKDSGLVSKQKNNYYVCW